MQLAIRQHLFSPSTRKQFTIEYFLIKQISDTSPRRLRLSKPGVPYLGFPYFSACSRMFIEGQLSMQQDAHIQKRPARCAFPQRARPPNRLRASFQGDAASQTGSADCKLQAVHRAVGLPHLPGRALSERERSRALPADGQEHHREVSCRGCWEVLSRWPPVSAE